MALRVFISYARADAERLAARLDRDLAAAGFDAWRDRSEITGGQSWSGEIERALDDCDVLLAVLTRGSFGSPVCRGEQLRALRKGARILPLLAQPDADRPVYLEAAHWLDFSDEAAWGLRFAELTQHLLGSGGLDRTQLSEDQLQRVEEQFRIDELARRAAARPAGETVPDWASQAQALNRLAQAWWDALAARRGAAGVYEPALHVTRGPAEAELDRWRESRATHLLLVGAAGVGKTHLLAHWLDARRQAGDAVWVIAGERTEPVRLAARLAHDLGEPDADRLPQALQRIERVAGAAGARLWIVVDGIHDTPGPPEAVADLLTAIEALPVPRGGAVRVAFSCSLGAWDALVRDDAPPIDWGRHHQPAGSDLMRLDGFTEAEAEAAFARHAARFDLRFAWRDLPATSRRRLRDPLLMRLMAEALQGRGPPSSAEQFDTRIFQHYWERFVRGGARERLADALAGVLLAQRRGSLPRASALATEPLAGLMAAHPQDMRGLLDDGVLCEAGTRSIFEDTTELRFTHPQIASYAVVRLMLQRVPAGRPGAAPDVVAPVRELVAAVDEMPLLWESALTLLGLRGTPAQLGALAGDADARLRELAVQALVRRHASEPAPTLRALMSLVVDGDAQQQRSAIRAAYHIGPAARAVLEHCALSNRDPLRLAVRDTLYFIWSSAPSADALRDASPDGVSVTRYLTWRHAPDFTERLIEELCERASPMRPLETKRIGSFVGELLLTIHVNHCDRPEVTALLVRTVRQLARKLWLTREASPAARTVMMAVLSRLMLSVVGEPVRDWLMLVNGSESVDFFDRPATERAPIGAAVDWIDPRTELATAQPLLEALLSHPDAVFRSIGAFVVGVHALADADAAEPVVRRLFDRLAPEGRAWLVASMTLLIHRTPARWLPLLDALTQRLVAEHRATGGPPALVPFFDGLYVPLALAAAKAGTPVPLFDRLLADAGSAHGPAEVLLRRLLAGLGVAGFYQPQAVLRWLAPHLPVLLTIEPLQPSLVEALATIRTLHDEAVDLALADAGAGEPLRQQVIIATEPARVQAFMRFVGFYNNVVHQCVHVPALRVGLAQFALGQLASAGDSETFARAYAARLLQMTVDADFDLARWFDPPAAPGAPAVAEPRAA